MSTESEVILERYKAREKEPDALGRVITVRRLKPSEQSKVAEYCKDLTGSDDAVNPSTGDKVSIPHRMPLLVAAAVCMIDDVHIPFPRDRGQLDAIYDRLDVEGIAAAGAAFGRLSGSATAESLADAKN